MSVLEGHEDVLEVELIKDEVKGILYKLSITEFRGKNYLSIRQWYLDFEGEYAPTKNGFTVPYTLDTVFALFDSLSELLSKAEVLHSITNHTKEK
jgi:hypothetical protein